MITVLRRSDKQGSGRISLRASSSFGGYREKSTRERHAREDETPGGGGGGGGKRGKFGGGRRGPLSIYFDFRNVIFQLMVFPFVKTKYK